MPYSPSLDLTSLDRTVDPCVNFYKYACGGWQKMNPIPADQATWDVYAKLANENQQFLWGILEQDAKATDRTPVQQKVGDYFAACMNTAAINADGDKPIQPRLRGSTRSRRGRAARRHRRAASRRSRQLLLPLRHRPGRGRFLAR